MTVTNKRFQLGVSATLLLLLSSFSPALLAQKKQAMLAETPPMGWNSWDSYGTTVNEQQVKANADWMAQQLKASGWQYIVVDMEWFVTNPIPEGKYANMWRISNDTWDLWHSTAFYPQGLVDQFPRAAQWASLSIPGHWSDSDMLPWVISGLRPAGESRGRPSYRTWNSRPS